MKVLWFTSTSSNFNKSNHNYNGCGWIESLEKQFENDIRIEIGICFYYHKKAQLRAFKNITYFPILKQRSINNPIKAIYNNYIGKVGISNLDRINQVIDSYKPNIIHVFGTENCFINIKNYTKIPVVFHLQGLVTPLVLNFFPPNTSQMSILLSKYFFFQNLLSTSPFFQYKKWINQAKLEKSILKDSKYISGRTNWDSTISKMLSSDSKYFHIDEVLRDEFYLAKMKELKSEYTRTIKIASTISPSLYKGIDVIFLTLKHLNDFYNIRFEWTVIGVSDNSSIVKYFKNKLLSRSFNSSLFLVGKKNASEIVDILNISDLYVHPSRFENSPNSICEAQLIGLPVIAFDTGGISSLILQRETGVLVPNGDILLLANEIYNLSQNIPFSNALSIKANAIATNRNSKYLIKEKVYSMYKHILNDSK
jgi:glycosyltransferase involved in cell wall biosynthesis